MIDLVRDQKGNFMVLEDNAFGRREQDNDEFFATAADVVRDLDAEILRFDPAILRAREEHWRSAADLAGF